MSALFCFVITQVGVARSPEGLAVVRHRQWQNFPTRFKMAEGHSEARIRLITIMFNLRLNLPEREADGLRLM